MISYFKALNRYWHQLDILDAMSWSCLTDGKQYNRLVETKRIYKFLLGLNQELDEVRGRILGTKPMPNNIEVFSEVRRKKVGERLCWEMLATSQMRSQLLQRVLHPV